MIDGRLIAVDAATGELAWEVQTTDRNKPYSITGAPRVVKDKVIIGNGGAEFGVRGYVTAYDAATGEEAWRFYIVPGNPADGFESPAMEMAAKTWNGERCQAGHRRVRLALPGRAGRKLGLQLRAANDPGRPGNRREAKKNSDAGGEERILLYSRPDQR
jgi:hypothetical protein